MPEQSPERDELLRYIRENSTLYTPEAIREHLLAVGHTPDQIDAAFAEVRQTTASPTRETFAGRDFWLAFVLYVVAFIAGVYLALTGVPRNRPYGLTEDPLLVFIVVAFILGLWAWRFGPFSPPARRGIGWAMAVVIVAPFVLFVGLYAYCLVAGFPF